MRPPFLQYRSHEIDNLNLQKLQWQVRSGVLMPYSRNVEYLHSWDPSSIPFTMDDTIESHALIFYPQNMRKTSIDEITPTAAEIKSPTSCPFQLCIYALLLIRICAWSLKQT